MRLSSSTVEAGGNRMRASPSSTASSRCLCAFGSKCSKRHTGTAYFRRTDMRLEEHFESSSTLQRNERVKLAASFWNNVGAGMVIGGMAAAFFLEKPAGTRTKNVISNAGPFVRWPLYFIAKNNI